MAKAGSSTRKDNFASTKRHVTSYDVALHAGVLPALLIAFLGMHIYVFRRHGITVPDPDRAPETTF